MFIAELAKRVGLSVDTIKSWEQQGLLMPARDDQDRRVYREEDVALGLELAKLGIVARRRSQKLSHLVEAAPKQLSLLGEEKKLVS
jgi:predicted site-specific integrase-resolvase